jgi:Arylsulfotransferase (ASST)
MALIMNRQGKVVHTWEVDLGQLWEDTPNHTGFKSHEDIATGGLHLYDNGDLLANFVSRRTFPFGIGMAKFDKDGDVLWQRANFSHHWFSVAPDGLIYTPAHRLVDSPLFLGDTKEALNCDAGKIYADVILVVNPNGDTVAEISVLDLLIEQGFIGLLLGVDGCDPIHLNYVEYVTGDAARDTRGLLEGDLVISTLEQNMIAAIDGTTRKLKWVLAGKTARQHSPRLLADGSIIAFDNKGGKRQSGGSRLVRIEYGSDVVAEVFPRSDGDAGINFYTENAGHIDPHPDGTRALVSLTRQGRVLEIDLQHGRVLWELINTHDPGRYADQVGADQGQVVRFSATGAYYVDERVLESLVD